MVRVTACCRWGESPARDTGTNALMPGFIYARNFIGERR